MLMSLLKHSLNFDLEQSTQERLRPQWQLSASDAAQADYVISILEGRVVCTNQTNQKGCHRHLIMSCCSRMSLERTTENMAAVLGPFIKWSTRKTINRETHLTEYSCLNPHVN